MMLPVKSDEFGVVGKPDEGAKGRRADRRDTGRESGPAMFDDRGKVDHYRVGRQPNRWSHAVVVVRGELEPLGEQRPRLVVVDFAPHVVHDADVTHSGNATAE